MPNDMIDTLRAQIAGASDDRTRMTKLMELSLHLLNRDVSEAVAAVNEALVIATALDDRRSRALCHIRLGDCRRVAGDFQGGLDHLDIAEGLSDGVENRPRLMSMLYRSRGLILRSQGDVSAALELFERSLEAAREAGDGSRIATVLATIGDTYRVIGDLPKALEIMLGSLRYWESAGNVARRIGVLNDIGIVYAELGEHPRALQVFEESLKLCREIGDTATEIMVMGNLGRVHTLSGEMERALEYELAALAIYRKLGRKSDEAATLTAIAQTYERLGDIEQALASYSEALDICGAIGHQVGRAEAMAGIGRMAIALGRRGDGLVHLLEALGIAEEIAYTKLACELHQSVAEFYEADGELARSLAHYKRSLQLTTELESQESIRAVAKVEMRAAVDGSPSSLFREKIAQLEDVVNHDHAPLKHATLNGGTLQASRESDTSERSRELVATLMRRMGRNMYGEAEWQRFERGFREVYPGFIPTLSTRYPTLTPTELRVCALLKVNLASKEIAGLLSTSVRTVEGHRHHIRRKLGVSNGISLTMFLAAM